MRIQQKLTKKVRFLQKVAANKPQKLAVKAGVGKVSSGPGEALEAYSVLGNCPHGLPWNLGSVVHVTTWPAAKAITS